jgi:hypothetical protein
MTEKRQISQGYIIRILQHFATKLRNITNFVMVFQAVMKSMILSMQAYLDQNFTHKGKGLLVYMSSRIPLSQHAVVDANFSCNYLLKKCREKS